jgi:hypothetical protein
MPSFYAQSNADKTDYLARVSFLIATTEVLIPAPIDLLLNKLVTFRSWLTRLDEELDPNSLAGQIHSAVAAIGIPTIGQDDKTPEALALRIELSQWMEACRFSDSWIKDAAVTTLSIHARGRAAPRGWYLQPPWDPDAREVDPGRSYYSIEDYIKELNKALRRLDKIRNGVRAYQELHAKWTALRFKGLSFKAIAALHRRDYDPNIVQKAVYAFCRRAGLTLPKKKLRGIGRETSA